MFQICKMPNNKFAAFFFRVKELKDMQQAKLEEKINSFENLDLPQFDKISWKTTKWQWNKVLKMIAWVERIFLQAGWGYIQRCTVEKS